VRFLLCAGRNLSEKTFLNWIAGIFWLGLYQLFVLCVHTEFLLCSFGNQVYNANICQVTVMHACLHVLVVLATILSSKVVYCYSSE
jgi:ABC-type Mn2+/Zn2+ transport system permease subunit